MLVPSTRRNDLNTVVRTTIPVPDPTEAECDRYMRYHNSNQWGR